MKDFMIKYMVELLLAGFVTAIGGALRYGYKKTARELNTRLSEQDAMKEGILAMLHDRLYQEGERLLLQEHCTIEERKNIEYIYQAYHKLGGNGTGTEIYNRVMASSITNTKEGM